MDKMRAAVIDHDAPGHVSIKEINMPKPAPDEALVRVAATSLNLGEVRYAAHMEPGSQIGWDLSGTVEEPAADGSGPGQGARVVGFLPGGAWAEYATVPTHALTELPEDVSFAQAATLPVAGLTALYALEKNTGLLNRNVLVTGANGGVGLFACQLGCMMGARVVGLVRREEMRGMVLSAGADQVVVSEDGSLAEDQGPYRLIVESVGGPVFGNVVGMLDRDGVCVSLATSAGEEATINIRQLMTRERASIYGFLLFNEVGREPAGIGLARLADLMADDRLKPFIHVKEDWSRIGEVAQDLWERRIPGKAVLEIS